MSSSCFAMRSRPATVREQGGRIGRHAALLVVVGLLTVAIGALQPARAADAALATARFVPLPPARILDTRDGGAIGRLGAAQACGEQAVG